MKGYLVKPADQTGKLGTVIVIHENRGLNPHIRDVARRVALEGFVALAPDFLSPLGGTPDDEDKARDMFAKLDPAQTVANGVATVAFLKADKDGNGKVGAVGFCWGGGTANMLAVNAPDLAAGVAYYGMQPKAEDVPKIKAALLLHYAGLDERINAGIDAFKKALDAGGMSNTRSMSMKAPTMPSTTTRRRRATTRRRPTSPGAGRSPSSRRSWRSAVRPTDGAQTARRPATR